MNKKRILIIVGIVVAAVVVAILLDTMLANHHPAITGLEAERERVLPGTSCQIVCTASDADGDELSYNWSASVGKIIGEGGTVTWVAPNYAGFYDVTVTVTDGRGGEATKTITIEARTNKPPIIIGLAADEICSLSSGSLQVTCNASDPDGDELSYEWSTTAGNISGTGAVVNWTAPEEVGVYNVTAVVKDGYGGSDTRTLPISVVTGQPPIIEDLLITKDRYGHCYLKKSSTGYYVGQGQMYDIECIVADTGTELSYEWSYTGGVLSGERSLVTWTAPNTSGKVTITVTVSDIAGNMASMNLVLSVVSCSKCTFGYCG
ncbi:MAG: Ig-like domain-containing protein [Chloroflexota bacterium]